MNFLHRFQEALCAGVQWSAGDTLARSGGPEAAQNHRPGAGAGSRLPPLRRVAVCQPERCGGDS